MRESSRLTTAVPCRLSCAPPEGGADRSHRCARVCHVWWALWWAAGRLGARSQGEGPGLAGRARTASGPLELSCASLHGHRFHCVLAGSRTSRWRPGRRRPRGKSSTTSGGARRACARAVPRGGRRGARVRNQHKPGHGPCSVCGRLAVSVVCVCDISRGVRVLNFDSSYQTEIVTPLPSPAAALADRQRLSR